MNTGNKQGAGKAKARTPSLNPTKAKPSTKGEPTTVKSARNYSERTLKLLWGRAAGRCAMPNCRIEVFITERGYNPIWNIGEMGHIAASSDGGPRSKRSLSARDRDKYENLRRLSSRRMRHATCSMPSTLLPFPVSGTGRLSD